MERQPLRFHFLLRSDLPLLPPLLLLLLLLPPLLLLLRRPPLHLRKQRPIWTVRGLAQIPPSRIRFVLICCLSERAGERADRKGRPNERQRMSENNSSVRALWSAGIAAWLPHFGNHIPLFIMLSGWDAERVFGGSMQSAASAAAGQPDAARRGDDAPDAAQAKMREFVRSYRIGEIFPYR